MNAKLFHRPSIRSSLIAIFSTIAAIFVALAFMTVSSLTVLHEGSVKITRDAVPSMLAAKDIRSDMLTLEAAYFTYITGTTPAIMKAAEDTIQKVQSGASDVVGRSLKLASSDREKQLLGVIAKGISDFAKKGEGVINLAKMSQYDAATGELAGMMEASQPAFKAMDELVAIASSDSARSVAAADQAYDRTRYIVFAVIGIILVLVLVASVYVLISIARPIKAITASMTHLADGDVDRTIPYSERSDEVGEMAAAVEVFRKSAIDRNRLEMEAGENRKAAEAERLRLTEETENAANRRLAEATSGLAAGLRKLAAGDLGFQLNDPFAADFEALRHDLNSAVVQLRETLMSVSDAAGSINDGTREVSGSADQLSRRTEQQAASLEQTAAALDEITANVANSSRRTVEAGQIVREATASAARSAVVVGRAVEAMQRIEESSGQIGNIISVIDQIAFQTNLLALNAGVEAARAGDAGKGFAVVAQEVRELAQRSASAAREIKGLIEKSGNEVVSGVRLVRETGDALKAIEGQITAINTHMTSIAASAAEQATGLGEVNSAVNQMDQVTQQNAAMVEETNASSAQLAQEAARLAGLISRFNLGSAPAWQENARPSAPVRIAAPMPSRPAENPVRKMAGRITQALGQTAATGQTWEEF
jgi:methyl-accepting chemotaxis protein